MTIDPSADRPVFRQMADILRERIRSGGLRPGQLLPSETHLIQEQGIARVTVRQALAVLRAEGLIVTVPRIGSYVRGDQKPIAVRVEPGARLSSRMPSPDERKRLQIPEGVPVFVVERQGRPADVLPADRTVIEFDVPDDESPAGQ